MPRKLGGYLGRRGGKAVETRFAIRVLGRGGQDRRLLQEIANGATAAVTRAGFVKYRFAAETTSPA